MNLNASAPYSPATPAGNGDAESAAERQSGPRSTDFDYSEASDPAASWLAGDDTDQAADPDSVIASQLAALSLAFPHKASPARGPGRWLRLLTGVDEDLLDRVWEERARYSGLGAIVLGTAIMAVLSMLDALDQVFGPVWPVLAVVGLFWGAFVCGIDRWLISSTHGIRASRLGIFLPRIALALLFGVIIATPLVLTVFGSEVVAQARKTQSVDVQNYESELKACNKLPGQVGTAKAGSAGCAGFRLSVADPAIGTLSTIAQELAQRRQLAATIAADDKTIARLNLVARKECNGTKGLGLSGIVGQGPNCHRDRSRADNFARTSQVSQLQTQFTKLDQAISSQQVTAGKQTQAYATAITSAIGRLVRSRTDDQGRIGLLNRIDALGALASTSLVIRTAAILLGLFIVAVDCLPVLSKMMSGKTRYDELVDGRLRTAEVIATAGLKVSERRATGHDEVTLQTIETNVRAQLEQIDEASRVSKAKRDADLDRRIAELAAEFRRQADDESAQGSAG